MANSYSDEWVDREINTRDEQTRTLQARINELAERLEKEMGDPCGYGCRVDIMKDENAKLRKVVDAARKALSSLESPHDPCSTAERYLRDALREFDAPRAKEPSDES